MQLGEPEPSGWLRGYRRGRGRTSLNQASPRPGRLAPAERSSLSTLNLRLRLHLNLHLDNNSSISSARFLPSMYRAA